MDRAEMELRMHQGLRDLVVVATMLVAVAIGSANAQTPGALAQNQRLGRGVNVLGYDPIWKDRQKARFQEKYFRLIKEAGFSHIRINLHPFGDAKLGANHKVSAAWFETLDWAIEHALANRLMLILDFHEFQAIDRAEEVDAHGMLETHHQKCPPPEPALAVALGGERVQSRPRGSLL